MDLRDVHCCQSHRAIAADLNERGVPSAGATWARKKHRAAGWMGSAVRVVLMNRLHSGEVCWNKARFVRNSELSTSSGGLGRDRSGSLVFGESSVMKLSPRRRYATSFEAMPTGSSSEVASCATCCQVCSSAASAVRTSSLRIKRNTPAVRM